MKKKAIVVHSGGMDSSICLALAIQEYGKEQVLSLSFSYQQRHSPELRQAEKICRDWQVDHFLLNIDCLQEITKNALMDPSIPIVHPPHQPPNTLVVGRNGLMAHIAAIHADHLQANVIYMGIIEVEGSQSGYRDCSRAYMNLMQEILRIDLANSDFEIRTPLVKMSKKETMCLANQMRILSYLLEETITCYEGIPKQGCRICPACLLRNQGLSQFMQENPDFCLNFSL